MPWRLVVTLMLMALMIVFVGLNLENASDISFGFYTFEEIPVYISLFAAFLLGVIVTLPFTILGKRKKTKLPKIQVEQQPYITAAPTASKKKKGKTLAASNPAPPDSEGSH